MRSIDTELPDWGEDDGMRGYLRLRCYDCGWRGESVCVTQYGTTDAEIEECPECGSDELESE